jgi:pilus assembly protein Flp/PilA
MLTFVGNQSKEKTTMIIKLLALKNAYLKDENGATAIEYALIAAGISLAIVASVFAFGDELEVLFSGLKGNLSGEQ